MAAILKKVLQGPQKNLFFNFFNYNPKLYAISQWKKHLERKVGFRPHPIINICVFCDTFKLFLWYGIKEMKPIKFTLENVKYVKYFTDTWDKRFYFTFLLDKERSRKVYCLRDNSNTNGKNINWNIIWNGMEWKENLI